jgi:hypothetical protein
MVAVAVVAPLIVTGVVDPKEQVISTPAGGTQVRLTMPVKPVPGTTVLVEVPEPPGALIVTAVPETVNPLTMVSVMVAEVDVE